MKFKLIAAVFLLPSLVFGQVSLRKVNDFGTNISLMGHSVLNTTNLNAPFIIQDYDLGNDDIAIMNHSGGEAGFFLRNSDQSSESGLDFNLGGVSEYRLTGPGVAEGSMYHQFAINNAERARIWTNGITVSQPTNTFNGNGGGLSNAVRVTVSGGLTVSSPDNGRTFNLDGSGITGGGGGTNTFYAYQGMDDAHFISFGSDSAYLAQWFSGVTQLGFIDANGNLNAVNGTFIGSFNLPLLASTPSSGEHWVTWMDDGGQMHSDRDILISGSISALGGINASDLSGTVPAARLGSGTPSSSTVLFGDSTWGSIPSSGVPTSQGNATNLNLYFGIPSGKVVYNGSGNFWIGAVDQVLSLDTSVRFLYSTNGVPVVDYSVATNGAVNIKTNLAVSRGTFGVTNNGVGTLISSNSIYTGSGTILNSSGDVIAGTLVKVPDGGRFSSTARGWITQGADGLHQFMNQNGNGVGVFVIAGLNAGWSNAVDGINIAGFSGNKTNVNVTYVKESYAATAVGFTLNNTNSFVNITATSQTVTLPTAVGIPGRSYKVKYSGATGTLTIATTSAETIDGTTPVALNPAQSRTYTSDGANWFITSGF